MSALFVRRGPAGVASGTVCSLPKWRVARQHVDLSVADLTAARFALRSLTGLNARQPASRCSPQS